eukprot:PhM_4_TR4246/c1_g1_i1/m.10007
MDLENNNPDDVGVPLGPLIRRVLRESYTTLRNDVDIPLKDPLMPQALKRTAAQQYCESTRATLLRLLVVTRWAREQQATTCTIEGMERRKRLRDDANLAQGAVDGLAFVSSQIEHAMHRMPRAPVRHVLAEQRPYDAETCARIVQTYEHRRECLVKAWGRQMVEHALAAMKPTLCGHLGFECEVYNGFVRIIARNLVQVDLALGAVVLGELSQQQGNPGGWGVVHTRLLPQSLRVPSAWVRDYKASVSHLCERINTAAGPSVVMECLAAIRDTTFVLVFRSIRLQCETLASSSDDNNPIQFHLDKASQRLQLLLWCGAYVFSLWADMTTHEVCYNVVATSTTSTTTAPPLHEGRLGGSFDVCVALAHAVGAMCAHRLQHLYESMASKSYCLIAGMCVVGNHGQVQITVCPKSGRYVVMTAVNNNNNSNSNSNKEPLVASTVDEVMKLVVG